MDIQCLLTCLKCHSSGQYMNPEMGGSGADYAHTIGTNTGIEATILYLEEFFPMSVIPHLFEPERVEPSDRIE